MAMRPDKPAEQGGAEQGAGTGAPTATRQRILLSDLTVAARIGVTEAERAQRQRLRINLSLEVSPAAPQHDRIAEVVDYGPLAASVRAVCAEAEFRLVESLARQIAAACFFDRRILAARVRVEKLDRYPDIAGIGCEIEFAAPPGSDG